MASPPDTSAAITALKRGLPIVFPTDTVAGLGVAVFHVASPAVLAQVKGRDEGKPIAWLVGRPDALDSYGLGVPDYAFDLAQQKWPGACTLVVQASDAVPAAFQSPTGTIGLRVPASPLAQELIATVGPLAATSANFAGQPAPASIQGVDPAIACAVASILDDGTQGSGKASSVIDCTGPVPRTLRCS